MASTNFNTNDIQQLASVFDNSYFINDYTFQNLDFKKLYDLLSTGIGGDLTLADVLANGSRTNETPIFSKNTNSRIYVFDNILFLSYENGMIYGRLYIDDYRLQIEHSAEISLSAPNIKIQNEIADRVTYLDSDKNLKSSDYILDDIAFNSICDNVKSGNWFTSFFNGTITSVNGWIGAVWFWPVFIGQKKQISEIGTYNLTAVAGGFLRIGIYSHDYTTNNPNSLIFDSGNIPTDTIGFKSAVGSFELNKMYWFAIQASSNAISLRNATQTNFIYNAFSNETAARKLNMAYGAMPKLATGAVYNSTVTNIIHGLKIA